MNKFLFILPLILSVSLTVFSQKKELSQEVYEDWNTVRSPKISLSGEYVSYKISPQKNDPTIVIYNSIKEDEIQVKNGSAISIDFAERFAFIRVKANKDTIRKLKVDEVKKDKFPHDTLRIINLKNKYITDLPHLKSYYCPDKGGEWIAIHFKEIPVPEDTTAVDSTHTEKEKPKKKKKKDKSIPECTTFIALNASNSDTISIEKVSDYAMDRYGKHIITTGNTGDSITRSFVILTSTNKNTSDTIFHKEGIIKELQIGDKGKYGSFFFSADTAKEKVFSTHLISLEEPSSIIQIDSLTPGMKSGWATNINHTPYFNDKESRLYLYTSPIPEPEVEDTLLDEEKCSVDVWNWKDPLLQTQQLHNKKEELKRGYLAIYNIEQKRFTQVADSTLPNVRTNKRTKGKYLLCTTPLPYQQMISWDGWYNDVFLFNTENGEKKKILEKQGAYASLSPQEKYVLWWNQMDSCWYSYNIATEKSINLTNSLNVNFYNEIHDMPELPGTYRVSGWLENDQRVIISDYYDLWMLDPAGNEAPVNMTNGFGREEKIRFSFINLLHEKTYLATDEESMLLKGFNDITKGSGYYTYYKNSNPEPLIKGDFRLGTVRKAKEDNTILWTKETFNEFPDFYISNLNFKKPDKISDINPQQDNYLWGDVQLVSWTTAKGEKLDGMLYTPENLDPEKKYPMLIYFYERNSDNLHRHRIPSPSRSIINPAYCTSNGYVVFVPDITYTTGHPGKDCFDAVVSGTLVMCDQFEFIDRDRMGLQGQSWGGYQIAHLVTQTDLYTCAMAGAPVSNMTSAYGGIRWGSGMSRAFQYEKSQSRIGQPLWDAPELYIENSPVFFADQVNTPLLIMHNDEDGAVPWYQGIEYFSALRRLQKPVWMLVYNGAPHNLSRWPDRMDLDKRMMQFFDHYLKHEPAPVWMTKGIPAVKKGIEKGFELE